MASKQPSLSIILVNYNGRFWLKKTLESLKEKYLDHTDTQVSVVVVDNGSVDDSVSMLKTSFRWVNVIALDENVGFAAANNRALQDATSTYIMLLNSDTELTDQSKLDELLAYMQDNPQVGVISPRVSLVNGHLDMASHRGEPTLWAAFTYYSGLEKIFPHLPLFSGYHQLYKDLTSIHEIDACSGAAMVVRRTAMAEVGLLDEQFFMYAEDLDWCHRFRDHGWKVVFYPEVIIVHHKYKSGISSLSKQTAVKTHHLFFDTMLQYYDKYYQSRYPRWVRSILSIILHIKKGAV